MPLIQKHGSHLKRKIMNEPKTIDEIGPYFIEAMNKVGPKVTGLAWDVVWSNKVSNSHSAPRGYKTNFMRDENKPTSYPGWVGRVWIRFRNSPEFMRLSDMMGINGIHPGTGGSGAYGGPWDKISHTSYLSGVHYNDGPHCYSWDTKIFDFDWPTVDTGKILKEKYDRQLDEYEKAKVWALLHNKYVSPFSFNSPEHKFLWTDPDVLLDDTRFIDDYLASVKTT